MMIEVEADICTAQEQYICHQCNCVSNSYSGLARTIFEKWPQANTYSNRTSTPIGTISIHNIGEDQWIVNMYAQYYPGFATVKDSASSRERYFAKCLQELKALNPTSVAFPYKIGCGLAGGNWENYYSMIQNAFDDSTKVVIYKFE